MSVFVSRSAAVKTVVMMAAAVHVVHAVLTRLARAASVNAFRNAAVRIAVRTAAGVPAVHAVLTRLARVASVNAFRNAAVRIAGRMAVAVPAVHAVPTRLAQQPVFANAFPNAMANNAVMTGAAVRAGNAEMT